MNRFIKILCCLSLALVFHLGVAQPSADSLTAAKDSIIAGNQDSIIHAAKTDSIEVMIDAGEIHPHKSTRKPTWLFFVFAAQMTLLAYLKVSFPKSIEDMLKAAFNINMAQQLYREQELTVPLSAIFYSINFVLSGGIFMFLLNHHFGWVEHNAPLVSLLFFLWAVILVYSLKYGAMKLVSFVFPFGSVVDYYNFNFFLIKKIAGLALFPLNFLLAYAPESLRTGLAVAVLVLVLAFVIGMVLKGLAISQGLIRQSMFHFFIYICTLEIAPVCILTKVVVEWVS